MSAEREAAMDTHQEETQGAAAVPTVEQALEETKKTQSEKEKETEGTDRLESQQTEKVETFIRKTVSLQLEDTSTTPKKLEFQESTASNTASGDTENTLGQQDLRTTKAELEGQPSSEREMQSQEESSKTPETQHPDHDVATLQTGYILDTRYRNNPVSEVTKVFLQSLDEECKETEPSPQARCDRVIHIAALLDAWRRVCSMLQHGRYLVLHGAAGCGKTTVALQILNHYQYDPKTNVHWCEPQTFVENFEPSKNFTLCIIDNFLGHTNLDNYDIWKPVYEALRNKPDVNTQVLLVTRTSVLEQALACTGADFAHILRKDRIVEMCLDHQALFHHMLPGTQEEPDFSAVPDIGFPLCFKLAASMPKELLGDIYRHPRTSLRSLIKNLIDRQGALLSLSLLAVTEGYVNARYLRNFSKLQDSEYLQILQSMEAGDIDIKTITDILDCYSEMPSLVQVDDDFVSFTNEAVREEVLCVLCESHAQFLAKHCSLRLLSRLALVTRDPDQTGDSDEKPVLPPTARGYFVQRILHEINSCNYRDSLTSALFEHPSFSRDVFKQLKDNIWMDKKYQIGLHFLFWASSCKNIASMLEPHRDKVSTEMIWHGLLGSCYYGNLDLLQKLLPILKRKKKTVNISSKIKELFPTSKDIIWKEAPFYPEDTLLTLAAWRGKDDVVKALLAKGAHIDPQGNNGVTALMHYCARGSVDMVTFLLERGASVGTPDSIDNTALHYALLGRLQTFHKRLLHSNMLLKINEETETPLAIACKSGAKREILDKLKDENLTENLSYLGKASAAGQTDVINYLLNLVRQAEWPPDFQDECVILALKEAFRSNKTKEIIDSLLPQLKRICDRKELRELCILSCSFPDDRILKKVLPVIKSTFDMDDAVEVACKTGNILVVEYLLAFDDKQKENPMLLLTASCSGSWELMKWLLENAKTRTTPDVIKEAFKRRFTELAMHLIESSDSRTGGSTSYLHLAASSDLCYLINWLLDGKCMNVDIEHELGFTPLQVAFKKGNERAVKCLLAHGASLAKIWRFLSTFNPKVSDSNKRLLAAVQKIKPYMAASVD